MPIRITKNTKSKQINLIPQDEFQSSNFGRILRWALSTFRVMVIVTELVVMSAFLSRFWLDAKNSDLNDEINVSKSQIIAFKNIEAEFRSLQKRISIAKTIYSLPHTSSIISNIFKFIPEDIVLTSVSSSENQLLIKGSSLLEKSIAQFLVNLEQDKDLIDINLSQVSSNLENSSTISFVISAKLIKLAEGGVK